VGDDAAHQAQGRQGIIDIGWPRLGVERAGIDPLGGPKGPQEPIKIVDAHVEQHATALLKGYVPVIATARESAQAGHAHHCWPANGAVEHGLAQCQELG